MVLVLILVIYYEPDIIYGFTQINIFLIYKTLNNIYF